MYYDLLAELICCDINDMYISKSAKHFSAKLTALLLNAEMSWHFDVKEKVLYMCLVKPSRSCFNTLQMV